MRKCFERQGGTGALPKAAQIKIAGNDIDLKMEKEVTR